MSLGKHDATPNMKRITQYILTELMKVFVLTLVGMTATMIIVGIAQEAIKQGLGPIAIIRLIPYVLPNALLFAVPGTILFAACTVYGRMSADNEIVALKSVGIPPWQVVAPVIFLSVILSAVTIVLNDLAVSWGRRGMNRVIITSVEEITYGMLRSQRTYATSRFSINVKDVVDRKLINPNLMIYGNEGAPITLVAQEAELRSDLDNDMLIVELFDGEIDFHGEAVYQFDHHVHEIPLKEASRKTSDTVKPSNYALRQIPGAIETQRERIKSIQQSLAAEASFQMVSGQFDDLTSGEWDSNKNILEWETEQLSRLQTEPWRRWANGFSCLCFVMVGAPLAIWRRQADMWTTFGVCFMPILLVYYPLLAVGVGQAKSGAWPPYGVWLGNLILVGIGAWLLEKVRRH